QSIRIDIVEGTVEQTNFHGLDRITSQRTIIHSLLKALLDGRNKFSRDHPANDTIDKVQPCLNLTGFWIRIFWSQLKYDVRKFTFTTGLLLVHLFVFNISKQGFFVSNLWSSLVDFNFEFPFQSFNDDLQVKLTHTSKNYLARLVVSINMKGRIFFYQF